MLQDAGDELVTERGDAEAARIDRVIAGKEVPAGDRIAQGHVEVRAGSGLIGEGFRHEGREQSFLGGIVLGHHPEKDKAIAHREGVAVLEVELELRVAVLVVE